MNDIDKCHHYLSENFKNKELSFDKVDENVKVNIKDLNKCIILISGIDKKYHVYLRLLDTDDIFLEPYARKEKECREKLSVLEKIKFPWDIFFLSKEERVIIDCKTFFKFSKERKKLQERINKLISIQEEVANSQINEISINNYYYERYRPTMKEIQRYLLSLGYEEYIGK